MEKLFRVKLKNGTFKDFADEKEANAYEAELILKELQENERQKKLEEERKQAEETEKQLLKELNDLYDKFDNKASEFEKATGKKLVYAYDGESNSGKLKATINTLDFTYNNVYDRLLRVFEF